jgi:hypothetical protein
LLVLQLLISVYGSMPLASNKTKDEQLSKLVELVKGQAGMSCWNKMPASHESVQGGLVEDGGVDPGAESDDSMEAVRGAMAAGRNWSVDDGYDFEEDMEGVHELASDSPADLWGHDLDDYNGHQSESDPEDFGTGAGVAVQVGGGEESDMSISDCGSGEDVGNSQEIDKLADGLMVLLETPIKNAAAAAAAEAEAAAAAAVAAVAAAATAGPADSVVNMEVPVCVQQRVAGGKWGPDTSPENCEAPADRVGPPPMGMANAKPRRLFRPTREPAL